MRMARALPAILLLATLGCSGFDSLKPVPREPDDVEELKKRVIELQRKAAVTEVELERLRRRLAELESGTRPADRAPAESDPPAAELQPVRRPVVIEDEGGPAADSGDFASSELPPEPQTAEPQPAEPSRRAPTALEEPSPVIAEPTILVSSDASVVLSEEGQALYDRGYTLFHQGRYVDAETTFQRFVQSYGATDLGDNASYWIGEARFARGEHEGALAAFLETAERYPQGNKVADSLLKAGQCLEVLEDLHSARQSYEEVVERYPQSAAATTALERLSALR